MTPKVTLIFLLYNAADTVEGLVQAALKQTHPAYPNQADWLEVLFMEDHSKDATLQKLHEALVAAGSPAHFRVLPNEKNLGLARTLNKAFGAIRTPYGLTCHVDVIFGRTDYVSGMLQLMESHPDAGAITGQPLIPDKAHIPTAEKFNIVCNLMDVFPAQTSEPLIPVGFAEGRCDIFRVEALKKAGFWDISLHASGEDQVLAAKMRQEGYQLYQAPQLTYYLSVSDEQNSVKKLLKHAHLFGRTQPYILLSNKNAVEGVASPAAGANRKLRMLLRASHLGGAGAYFLCLIFPVFGLGLIPFVFVLKYALMQRHLRAIRLTAAERLRLLGFIPLQDLYYTAGLVQGLWTYFTRDKAQTIR